MSESRDGVSVLELMVVMLFASIGIGVAVPQIRPEQFRMDETVVLVASILSAQQKNAILRHHDIVVAVDSAGSTLRVHHDADNDGTVDETERLDLVRLEEGVVFGRGGAEPRPLGAPMSAFADAQDGMPAVTFRRNGSASAESILYLTSERASRSDGSAYAADARAVEIERATGRVRCYSFASSEWAEAC